MKIWPPHTNQAATGCVGGVWGDLTLGLAVEPRAWKRGDRANEYKQQQSRGRQEEERGNKCRLQVGFGFTGRKRGAR